MKQAIKKGICTQPDDTTEQDTRHPFEQRHFAAELGFQLIESGLQSFDIALRRELSLTEGFLEGLTDGLGLVSFEAGFL